MLKAPLLKGSFGAPIPSLTQWFRDFPVSEEVESFVTRSRQQIESIIERKDKRLMVMVGPCSIHDVDAAYEYAQRLSQVQQIYRQQLFIVMRTYFEKPRTRTGWTGLIYDPHLDNTGDMQTGLIKARQLLLKINQLNVPTATEFLDTSTYSYLADLISWGSIGARTTESQVHRQISSGLPCPVGFKNATDGGVKVAIDAFHAAQNSHVFATQGWNGELRTIRTSGNAHGHIILRGGEQPNYYPQDIDRVELEMLEAGLPARIVVDCSHGNSQKIYQRQLDVVESVSEQIERGRESLLGAMLESHLLSGSQPLGDGKNLTYGQSITDPCLGWQETLLALERLADAVSSITTATRTLAPVA
ncbi:3-deoxy-7-phosphoheptulonate synthase [Aliikangiella sp. IMCC44359]|uniref:3-deoxy-7-phosphoheptulonate synthase n=1 Tax=Aliikangiella sp. IMCC44359 TaxID=3459125 RepID=UPI00403B3078